MPPAAETTPAAVSSSEWKPMAAQRTPPADGKAMAETFCKEFLTPHFWENHWEKFPLHWKASEHGETANQMPEALGPDEFMQVVSNCGASLKMFKRGEPYDLDDFLVGYLDGASVIINQADRCFAPLLQFCQELGRRQFYHVFGVFYLTPVQAQAVRLHNDDQDVFLMQVWGRKQWTIRNAPQLLPYTEEMLGKDGPVAPELIKEPVMEFTMEPHDILYIPRGYLHEACTGGEEPSLHITVTVPTSDYCWGVQLVKHLLNKVHTKDFDEDLQETCGSFLAVRGTPADVNGKELDEKIDKLLQSWADTVTVESVVEQFDQRMEKTNLGQERSQAERQARQKQVVTEGSRVRLMYGISCRCDPNSEQAMFSRVSDGQNLELSIKKSACGLIRSLTSRPQRVSDLPCDDRFERLCVLELLLRYGVVQLLLPAPSEEGE
eukprot:TRINITY_DN56296_c0_g1_i1.p1 TRINITY_DN56296_c0_g1~~TRINITY_DN56296_c0_g1_i1.p1  ORF type:complete len:459 (-),score=84.44 TRINITY_DN56296_c0_g1_i1:60-1364(-)